MRETKLWSYSVNDDTYFGGDKCSSRQEAIQAALQEAAALKITEGIIRIGQVNEFVPVIYAEDIITNLQNQADDEAGEYSYYYLNSMLDKHLNELQEKLQAAFDKWEDEHPEYKPNFYTVRNIEEFDLETLRKEGVPDD